ncbi:MAG: hypothetical protein NZM04_04950 [Methylacidiphilales bacterium]|nr:hypothetical protein [Candidatus Methylacidiphilales bacterium]
MKLSSNEPIKIKILEIHRKREGNLNQRSLFGFGGEASIGNGQYDYSRIVWTKQGASWLNTQLISGDPYDGQFKDGPNHNNPPWQIDEIKVTELSSGQEKEFLPKIEDPGWNKRRDWEVVLIPIY